VIRSFAVIVTVVGMTALVAAHGSAQSPVADASHPCAGPPFIFGDATDDSVVDFADVEISLRALVDPEQPFTHSACGASDVDCDGAVTALDALSLLAYTADMPYEREPGCPEIGSDTDG
jgi:hypothetical protein